MTTQISRSVGRGGANAFADVQTVQRLLNNYVGRLGIRRLAVDGRVGPLTIGAIERFQRQVVGFARPDGRVDPGGRTLATLNGAPSRPSNGGAGAGNESREAGAWRYPAGPQEGLIEVARPFLGARETGNNRMGTDPRMRAIFEADWLEPNGVTDGYAWCCAFVSLCLQRFIAQNRDIYGHVTAPRTPGVSDFRTRWAPRENCLIFSPNDRTYAPHKGDVVVFTFSHIGIVDTTGSGTVTTIEGNTNGDGSREGDGVYAKTRAHSIIRCFIRMPVPVTYDFTQRMCTAPQPMAAH